MQHIPDEQIEQFLQGRCTPEEAAAIAAYLEQHPEHALLQEEWTNADGYTELPKDSTQRMQEFIHARTAPRVSKLKAYWQRAAIAASLIGAVALGWNWKQQHTHSKAAAIAMVAKPKADTLIAWNQVVNNNTVPLLYKLPDSSKAILYAGASIRFHQGFKGGNTRDIYLEGKAQFTVAKDSKRPFTTFANGIATTALGTRFTVTSMRGSNKIKVQLHEGKVVIRPAETTLKIKDIYLLPGQECMVDKQMNTTLVTNSTDNYAVPAKHAKPPVVEKSVLQPLEFSRAMLPAVFDSIGKRYGVKISYSHANIEQLSFTGKFLPTDSLQAIINVICNIDDLTFEQQGNRIIIKKLN